MLTMLVIITTITNNNDITMFLGKFDVISFFFRQGEYYRNFLVKKQALSRLIGKHP